MRANILWITLVALAAQFHGATPAAGYGYAEAEDPVVVIFRDGVTSARIGDFAQASAKAKEALALIAGHKYNGASLVSGIEEAAKSKNAPAMAEILANVVYLSLKEKLEANIDTNLKDFNRCKARLFLARKNYLDVLEGNLKKNRPEDSQAILKEFDEAMAALGNPGLFGIGQKPADLARFTQVARKIEATIEGFYTRFVKQ
ncbi:MAG: hypothetical protein OEZ32_08380 [Nitrospinota bacterium]|nr:hypothetical protein [Nitrospinota bacterium]